MSTEDWGDGWNEGREQAIRDCIAVVEQALAEGLRNSSDGALYYFEADDEDPSMGHDVTFRKESIVAALRALLEGEK